MRNNAFRVVRELNALAQVMADLDDSFLESELRRDLIGALGKEVTELMHAANLARDAAKAAFHAKDLAVSKALTRIERVHAGYKSKYGRKSPEVAVLATTKSGRKRSPKKLKETSEAATTAALSAVHEE